MIGAMVESNGIALIPPSWMGMLTPKTKALNTDHGTCAGMLLIGNVCITWDSSDDSRGSGAHRFGPGTIGTIPLGIPLDWTFSLFNTFHCSPLLRSLPLPLVFGQ